VGAAGGAYKAGKAGAGTAAAREVLGQAPKTLGGRALGAMVSPEFGKAAELMVRSPARTAPGKYVENVVGGLRRGADDDYLKLIGDYGDAADSRGLGKMLDREAKFQMAADAADVADIHRSTRNLSPETGRRMMSYLESKKLRPDMGGRGEAALRSKLGEEGFQAYEKTWKFRAMLHDKSHDLGLIDDAQHAAGYGSYMPRIYEEMADAEKAAGITSTGGKLGPKAGRDAFRQRTIERKGGKYTSERFGELTRILDPELETHKMLKIANVIAKQEYAQKLATSGIAKDGVDLLAHAANRGHEGALALLKSGTASLEDVDDFAFETMGWKRVRDLFPGRELPGYLDRLEGTGLLDKFIDPAALDDVVSMFKMPDDFGGQLQQAAQKAFAFFRAGKTAYNPATHVRNYLSNIIFYHMATGRFSLTPTTGIKALRSKGGVDFREAIQAGVLGGSGLEVIKETLKKHGLDVGDITVMDWVGDSRLAEILKKGAGQMEQMYRASDDIWKLDAFIKIRNRYLKSGVDRSGSVARAALDVARFMPTFNIPSGLSAGFVGKAIPFSSFTNESLRIWKNVMTDKPHIGFFWNHMADTWNTSFAAASGISNEELDNVYSQMPDYQKGKQMMILPFRDGGKLLPLDLSFVIPLAGNMSELQTNEKSFFLSEFYDLTQNPLVGAATAMATGEDPFTGKPLEPRFAERQMGLSIDDPAKRKWAGLAEWGMRTMLPPLTPPGFAATNLLEAVKGQRDPFSLQELEPNIARTVAANIFGMRTYEASLSSEIQNVRRSETRLQERRTAALDRFKFAAANGDTAGMDREEANVRATTFKLLGDEKAVEAYWKGAKKQVEPGAFRGLSTKHLKEVLFNRPAIENPTDDEKQMWSTLYLRYKERTTKKRRGKSE